MASRISLALKQRLAATGKWPVAKNKFINKFSFNSFIC